ncbi:cdc42 effector protein 5 [Bufo bufo]|uniref:cdc42 effector protein 5 n=1 Tax=Bufo bufo TaxID=8384 RepID=UPI001ABE19DE|nr:cdc42 effector protein 5 [Bufo bufo]XP_040288832.1 cdc42 effector protein 5 [Bufo bufo]
MPILKQSSSHSKKRTRIDREMISAPLGDFRHTMHVGRGGDVFGDTSFLSNHGPASAPPVEVPKKNGLMKMAGDHEENKMADSLSQLSQSSGIGSGAGSVSSSPVNNVSSKEDSLWNNSNTGGNSDQFDWISPGDCGLKHAESMLSFHLDLGPSILDDVLGVMNRDPPTSEWNNSDDQRDFDFKFAPVLATDGNKHTQSSSITEPQGNHYSLSNTLPMTNPGFETISTPPDHAEGNISVSEEDSEEEKRSIYEGIADSPDQHDNSLHISHRSELDDEDVDEEEGQDYTFDDDLDDEIGV